MNKCTHFAQSRLPQACFLCSARVAGKLLCPGCEADLPALPACCPQCALPNSSGEVCGACLKQPPAFDRTLAVFAYAFPLDALVQQCKYAGATSLTAFFAERMAQRSRSASARTNPACQERVQRAGAETNLDYLLPMPLHPARLAYRGFNQAAEIARRLSPQVGIPWLADACQRIRDTPSQAGLDLKTRQRNLRGAFACNLDLSGKRVALIDDVMTSGSSLNELAHVVRKAGAIEIQAWVLARTL
ncbi:MAG: ComF family protein [Pseudomonadota bacterium]|nr:ComF family protein [Pseudomonadota bacterium]